MSAYPIKELDEVNLTPECMTFHEVTETVAAVTEKKAPRNWWIAFFIAASFAGSRPSVKTDAPKCLRAPQWLAQPTETSAA